MGTTQLNSSLIAPCGMNCGICMAYLRNKNKCPGCNSEDKNTYAHCLHCSIKNCNQLKIAGARFCFDCSKFPCTRLKNLDKRYRIKYGMSMIENLNTIKTIGIRQFIKMEKARWKCSKCNSILCVHKDFCLNCGELRMKESFVKFIS